MKHQHIQHTNYKNQYLLFLLLIFGIIITTLIIQYYTSLMTITEFMRIFMGLFFIIFGTFKMTNWINFAYAFAMYDIIAHRFILYSFIYPLIEWTLGITYLSNHATIVTHSITALIMFIGAIGVINSLRKKQEFQCACLGNIIKLPVSQITLIEDLGMGCMALYMIFV